MSELRVSRWSPGKIAGAMDARISGPAAGSPQITGVTTDTRALRPGELFVALRGERFDGHHFVEAALDAGAAAVVVDDLSSCPPGTAAIVVDDTLRGLAALGHALFVEAGRDGLHSVAVTGSNGKTTVKELLKVLWGTGGEVWATPGNLNNHIGVPLTLCGIPRACDHLIVEMGANHVGEISELIKLAPGDERIITSIGKAHLEGFGSLAGVRRGKSEIFEGADRETAAIVPADEAALLLDEEFPGRVLRVGAGGPAEVQVGWGGLEPDAQGRLSSRVIVEVDSRKWALSLPLVGRHNAQNLGAALATLIARDEVPSEAELNQALSGLDLPGGRLRVVRAGELEILDDAYNANPTSMRASYEAFASWCDEAGLPRLAVIGDMKELGDFADEEHRQLARWLAGQALTSIAFVGEFGPVMREAAADINGGAECVAMSEVDEISRWLQRRGAARVFLKGSRANRLERVIDALRPESPAPQR